MNKIYNFVASSRNPYATPPQCAGGDLYRTIDGTCNNQEQPWIGAAKTPLNRLAPNTYEDGKPLQL